MEGHGTDCYVYISRIEDNVLPTYMHLPLSKFESIHRVYIALRCKHNLL